MGVSLGLILGLFTASVTLAQVSSTSSESSSTTSGSIKRIFVQNDKERLHQFVDQNFDRLQEAAARGSGPILNDYVVLLGCKNPGNLLEHALQKNYAELFDDGKSQLVQRTTQMIENDRALAQACDSQS
jgi:hypothetical protein